MTPGYKTSEFIALIAGVLCAVLPVVMGALPQDSAVYVVLGSLLAVAVYIGGRSHVKAVDTKAAALVALSVAGKPADPPQG